MCGAQIRTHVGGATFARASCRSSAFSHSKLRRVAWRATVASLSAWSSGRRDALPLEAVPTMQFGARRPVAASLRDHDGRARSFGPHTRNPFERWKSKSPAPNADGGAKGSCKEKEIN